MSWWWPWGRRRRRRVRIYTVYKTHEGLTFIVIHPREPERVRATAPKRQPAPEHEAQLALPLALEPAE